jgi:hypothetical protein
MSVHHHGVYIWNRTEPTITPKNIIPGCIFVSLSLITVIEINF